MPTVSAAVIGQDARPDRTPRRLDAQQVGSIRQIDNITRQLDGEWAMMGARAPFQQDFGAFRFQLAFAGYALALGHFHRLPNAPGVFKPIFERLIHKMMLPDVWSYWRDVSRGGAHANAHLKGSLKEEWDPIKADNIMYSAYLQVLTLMFNYLFDDDRYAAPGALKLSINPFNFGDRHDFIYDQNSLNDHVYWQMVESGYIGVACEPNCVFQICNQIPILGFRLSDILHGTDRATEVTEGYLKAWSDFGLLDERENFMVLLAMDSKTPIGNPGDAAWSNAWLAAMMHAWSPALVERVYPTQIKRALIPGDDGALGVRLWDPVDVRWAAACASELGDAETLHGLLAHADRYMNPTWRDGGLYYPRNDARYDERGILRQVEPITGNALLPYARLNVANGLNLFYNQPWGRDHFAEPLITHVSETANVVEARFENARTLRFAIEPRADRPGAVELTLANVFSRGPWRLSCDQALVASGHGSVDEVPGDVLVRRTAAGFEIRLERARAAQFELDFPSAQA
jgi:hypothetical protein